MSCLPGREGATIGTWQLRTVIAATSHDLSLASRAVEYEPLKLSANLPSLKKTQATCGTGSAKKKPPRASAGN